MKRGDIITNEVNKNMFWNIRRTLTYSNILFFLILGNRGGGKTYGFKEWAIDDFIKNRMQFGYIRRYKDDLKEPMKQYFKDIEMEYPDYEFKTDNKYFYIRLRPSDPDEKWTEDDIAGYGFTLSTANNKKSISYPRINKLCFDEFLLDKGNQHYLQNEPIALLNLYETIARPGTGHCRVLLFMLANALTITNPYFLFFGLQMPTKQDKNGKWIWKHPDKPILVEDVRNDEFIDVKRGTDFGKLITGTNYEGYSIDNKFLLDDDTFIEEKSPRAKYWFTINYKNEKFGVWISELEGLLFVSSKIDPNFPLIYSLTMKDHKPNMVFIKNKSKAGRFKMFIEQFNLGNVRFDNMNIKNLTYEIIKMVGN